jgi:hypothetical protein
MTFLAIFRLITTIPKITVVITQISNYHNRPKMTKNYHGSNEITTTGHTARDTGAV